MSEPSKPVATVDPLEAGLGTAASHATTSVPRCAPNDSVSAVFASMRGSNYGSAQVIAVCDGERLAGLITIERLLAAADATSAASIMDASPPTVAPGTDQERAAWVAIGRGESALAVVDGDEQFRGVIPPQRLLDVLLEEHDEDWARLGGYLATSSAARDTSTETVPRRLWHRLPWLLVGLAGAIVAAVIVGAFEHELEKNVLIAFFIPGVVYLADAVGTQTEAIVIRGLSVGVSIRSVLGREIATGLLLGLALAFASFPIISMGWGDPGVALAVAIALFGACAVASLVAMSLPWILNKTGRDPAFGSGPLATVIQDLLSILIYFGAVALVLS